MFLNPFLLFGLTAISVPIIIHLLNRRKFDRIAWAAMRFLKVSIEKNRRRLNVEDILLLLLRCLIVCLLALTLARPIWRHAALAALGRGRVTAAIILDNSYSMAQTDGTETRFAQAKNAIDAIIDSFPSGSSTALLLASDIVNPVISEPTVELGTARQLVQKAALTDRTTDLLPAIQKALAILKDKPAAEIYVVTDGQALGWKQSADIRNLLEAQKDQVKANVIRIGEPETTNLGISNLRLTADLAIVNQPLRFEVQVTNYGQRDVRDVPVRLALDGDPPSEETTIAAIPAGESRSVSLFGRCKTEGLHSITAHLPPDRLAADDARSIMIHCIKRVDVLVVDGDPGATPRDSETYLLQEALQPVDPLQRGDFYIQVKTIGPADLESTRLEAFDAVLLANVPDFSAKTIDLLMVYLRQGNGLIFFPGNQTSLAFYNDELFRRRGILPAGLGQSHGDATQTAKFTTFQTGRYEHPIAARWNDAGGGRLDAAHFFRWFGLEAPTPVSQSTAKASAAPSSEVGPTQIVLRYADGSPAIAEHTWAGGRVVLFSSTASTKWNDLAAHPQIFIPLLHRAVGSILQRGDDSLNIKVGQKFVLHTPAEFLGHDAAITPPPRLDAPHPDSRRVVLQDDKPTLTYDTTDLAGIYTIAFAGNPPTTFRFAAQQDPKESRLDPIPAAQQEMLRSVANVVTWKPDTQLTFSSSTITGASEFWKNLALLVICLAIAETLLAHWFSAAK